jgi:hypothetical protein
MFFKILSILQGKQLGQYLMVNDQGNALVQSIDMTISGDHIFFIDSGTLYSGTLPSGDANVVRQLSVTAILTPTAQVDGFPVKEIVAVDAENFDQGVVVLDKSNDIFIYDYASRTWSLHRPKLLILHALNHFI